MPERSAPPRRRKVRRGSVCARALVVVSLVLGVLPAAGAASAAEPSQIKTLDRSVVRNDFGEQLSGLNLCLQRRNRTEATLVVDLVAEPRVEGTWSLWVDGSLLRWRRNPSVVSERRLVDQGAFDEVSMQLVETATGRRFEMRRKVSGVLPSCTAATTIEVDAPEHFDAWDTVDLRLDDEHVSCTAAGCTVVRVRDDGTTKAVDGVTALERRAVTLDAFGALPAGYAWDTSTFTITTPQPNLVTSQSHTVRMTWTPPSEDDTEQAPSTINPTGPPTEDPTDPPSEDPTGPPTEGPTAEPSGTPSEQPSGDPTEEPTEEPTAGPGEQPTDAPSAEPTGGPSEAPTERPSEQPTETPSEQPTDDPSDDPSDDPIEDPSTPPSEQPTDDPGDDPSEDPSPPPSDQPTDDPSDDPSTPPSEQPTEEPTADASEDPSSAPGQKPTDDPSELPTEAPSEPPSAPPSSPIDEPAEAAGDAPNAPTSLRAGDRAVAVVLPAAPDGLRRWVVGHRAVGTRAWSFVGVPARQREHVIGALRNGAAIEVRVRPVVGAALGAWIPFGTATPRRLGLPVAPFVLDAFRATPTDHAIAIELPTPTDVAPPARWTVRWSTAGAPAQFVTVPGHASVATLRGLVADREHVIEIRAVLADGTRTAWSSALRVATRPRED